MSELSPTFWVVNAHGALIALAMKVQPNELRAIGNWKYCGRKARPSCPGQDGGGLPAGNHFGDLSHRTCRILHRAARRADRWQDYGIGHRLESREAGGVRDETRQWGVERGCS